MIDRGLLLEYLRQRTELGERELYLDSLSAEEFVRRLNARGAARAPAVAAAVIDAQRDFSQLAVLQQQAATCTACSLHTERTNAVFARGDPQSPIVVVGEAPGEEEDRTGLPFVGRAGRLLDLMLSAIGFPKDSVYICNTLKCRPPGNRNPLPDELSACNGFLRQQLEIVAPRVLLAVGKFAAQTLLQSDEAIGRLRGRVHTYEGRPVVVTYHPAYLLRSPHAVRTAWHDFQLLRQVIDEQA
ncbi:MAG TPA: uracil-DNA glycosylase [Longimicrobiales bacterium]|nr:uracil-DNA glycosylase [Longimicrobiales bacterium]